MNVPAIEDLCNGSTPDSDSVCGGSNPSSSARKRQVSTEACRFQLYSPYGELYAPSVRDICFASDMPAGVRGEYNITETVGFNITIAHAIISLRRSRNITLAFSADLLYNE